MIKALAQNFNGITMAYVMGLVNALLGLLLAFGVNLSETQQGAIIAFVNAAMIVMAHMGHRLGEVSVTPLPPATSNAKPEAAPDAPPAPVG